MYNFTNLPGDSKLFLSESNEFMVCSRPPLTASNAAQARERTAQPQPRHKANSKPTLRIPLPLFRVPESRTIARAKIVMPHISYFEVFPCTVVYLLLSKRYVQNRRRHISGVYLFHPPLDSDTCNRAVQAMHPEFS